MPTKISDVLKEGKWMTAPAPVPAQPTRFTCAPSCPLCGGLGLVRFDVPMDDERFGRLSPCPNLPTANRHVITLSGLFLDELDRLTWDAIRPEELTWLYHNARKRATAVTVANAIRKYLDAGPGMIYLSGKYGLGKSHIVKTAIAERVRSNQPGLYVQFADVIDNIRAGFDATDPRDDARARLERYRNHPFLAIDELDKVQETPWIEATLFRLIDKRYELALMGLATTLLASNNSPEYLSEAIASRIRDGRCLVIEIEGADIRPRMTR